MHIFNSSCADEEDYPHCTKMGATFSLQRGSSFMLTDTEEGISCEYTVKISSCGRSADNSPVEGPMSNDNYAMIDMDSYYGRNATAIASCMCETCDPIEFYLPNVRPTG